MKGIIGILLAFSIFSPGNAQLPKIDSLNFELEKAQHDSIACRLSLEIGMVYDGHDTDSALYYTTRCIKLAEKIGLKKKASSALNFLGSLYRRQGQYEKAMEAFVCASIIDDELGDKLGLSKNYNNMGLVHSDQGNYEKAIEFIEKSLALKKELGDKRGIAASYVNIGIVYRHQGNYNKSIEQYMNSIRVLEELNDKDGVARCLNNIGNIHYGQKNFGKALEFFTKSMEIVEEIKDIRGLARSYNNIGIIYREQKNYEKALEFYHKAIEISKELGDKKTLAITYNNVGNIYKALPVYDKALEYINLSKQLREEIGDKQGLASAYIGLAELNNMMAHANKGELRSIYLDEAKTFGEMAYNLADEIGALPAKNSASNALAYSFSELKNYKKALWYANISLSIKDSLFNEEKTKAITDIQTKYETEKKQQEIEKQQLIIEKNEFDYKQQRTRLNFFIIGSVMLAILAFSILLAYRQKNRSNNIIREKNALLEQYNEEIRATSDALALQNEQLKEQNEEIEKQRNSLANLAWELQEKSEEIENQRNILSHQNKEITDSIVYAQRIQNAVLPAESLLSQLFTDHFILYKPKSIVSGDFYWATQIKDLVVFCVTDCTGHGVPGAFMSMMGISFLNEIVRKEEVTDAAKVLDQLRSLILSSMVECDENHIKLDGMDMGLCVINTKNRIMQFAGANIPCWIASDNHRNTESIDRIEVIGGLTEIKPDRMPIARFERMDPFTCINFQLMPSDTIYLATDGFADQFGGTENKKFQKHRLMEVIGENCHKPLPQQKEILGSTFENWRKGGNQLDDVTILGVRI